MAFMAMVLYVLSATPLLFLGNSTTYTDMLVVNVETDLPVIFLDSHRQGADDFTYYQFDLQPEEPLHLAEVIVSNETGSKGFKYFDVKESAVYLEAGQTGEPLHDSIELDSAISLITKDTLTGKEWGQQSRPGTNFFEEDTLNVLFKFKEGTAKVKYRFFDEERMAGSLASFKG